MKKKKLFFNYKEFISILIRILSGPFFYNNLKRKIYLVQNIQNYFPENTKETFYTPTQLGYEEFISKRLKQCWPNRYK